MVDPVTVTAGLIAGAKTAKELMDAFSSVCSSLKGAAEGGKQLAEAGSIIGSIFDAEDRVEELTKQAKSKGNLREAQNLVSARAFIREEKRKTRTVLAWACPTGMYQDWVAIEKLRGEFQEDLENELPSTQENMARAKKARKDDTIMDMIKVMLALIGVILTLLVTMGKELKKVIGNL